MNQNRKEELVTRWMDDALTEAERREIEPILAVHPELQKEREVYARLRKDLKAAIPAAVEPPYPDFFNTHLERHIEGLARGGLREATDRRTGLGRWWSWMMAPAATAALVMAFLAGMNSRSLDIPAPLAEATTTYSPVESVTAEAVQDVSLDATVIVLSGLDKIEDENLIGWQESRKDASPVYVSTTTTF